MRTAVKVDRHAASDDRRLIRFGLIGLALGCALGMYAVTRVSGKEMMYTVIVPMSLSYWGLAIGLFIAMWVPRARTVFGAQELSEVAAVGSDEKVISATFESHERAAAVIAQLTREGIDASRFTVIGRDCDALRFACSPLYTKRMDKLIVACGALGAIAGIAWGVLGMPALASSLSSATMSAVMSAFCGALLGALTGAQAAAVLHVDQAPVTEAKIIEGEPVEGVVALGVNTADAEAERVRSAMSVEEDSAAIAVAA